MKFKNLTPKAKKLLTTVFVVALSGGILTALWLSGPASITGSYIVESDPINITFTKLLSGATLNVQDNNLTVIDLAKVYTQNPISANVYFNISYIDDLNDSCDSFQGDCIGTIWLGNLNFGYGTSILLTNGDVINLIPGADNNISAKIFCKQLSCNQEVKIDLQIIPILE